MRLRPIWSCALCFNNSLAVILISFECRNVFMVTARTRALFDRFSDVSENLENEMWMMQSDANHSLGSHSLITRDNTGNFTIFEVICAVLRLKTTAATQGFSHNSLGIGTGNLKTLNREPIFRDQRMPSRVSAKSHRSTQQSHPSPPGRQFSRQNRRLLSVKAQDRIRPRGATLTFSYGCHDADLVKIISLDS